MKTTFDLPDELMRALEQRAGEEHRTLTALVTELLWRGLVDGGAGSGTIRNLVKLPLVYVASSDHTEDEMTPHQVVEAHNDHVRSAEDERRERAERQRKFFDSLEKHADLDVLASDEMWR